MSNGASAQVAQRVTDELTKQDKSLKWLSEQTGIPYVTLHRKVSAATGDFSLTEVALITKALAVDAGVLVGDAIKAAA